MNALMNCPEEKRARYEKTAKSGTYRAAVKLKCLDCCGWEHSEVKRCEIKTCSLYEKSARIFGREGEPQS